MKVFSLFVLALQSLTCFASETPMGTLGNPQKILSALREAGAESKSSLGGKKAPIELIRAADLVCKIESAPNMDALCTFYTKNEKNHPVKGVASSEGSWTIGFSLIAAGAKKTVISDNVSEIRVKSLVCNVRGSKSDSDCTFMQEE